VLATAETTSASNLHRRQQHLGRIMLSVGLGVHGLMLEFTQRSLPPRALLNTER
jgi:hypothetical protein